MGARVALLPSDLFWNRGSPRILYPALKTRVGKLVVGDPMDEKTQVGPLSSVKQAMEVEKQVKRFRGDGSKTASRGTPERGLL